MSPPRDWVEGLGAKEPRREEPCFADAQRSQARRCCSDCLSAARVGIQAATSLMHDRRLWFRRLSRAAIPSESGRAAVLSLAPNFILRRLTLSREFKEFVGRWACSWSHVTELPCACFWCLATRRRLVRDQEPVPRSPDPFALVASRCPWEPRQPLPTAAAEPSNAPNLQPRRKHRP